MKRKLLTTLLLGALSLSAQAAVSISNTGKGDLIILPYYTVKNDMNTHFTLTNHSATQGKLISVSYKESKNNHDVLFYNVFLKPNSSWAVGLGSVDSTLIGHEGEPSLIQHFNSEQCAPFLSNTMEFAPYSYEQFENNNLSLERAQEGHVEIYELGSLDPNNSGLNFNDCASIESVIVDNDTNGTLDFMNELLSPSKGEISATVNILNVNEGTSYSYNGVAFNNFSDSEAFTFDDFPYLYDFNDASTSALITVDGVTQETQWNSGAESMNALIASHSLSADYTVEAGNNSQTEVVLSIPGKIYMNSGSEAIAPFTETYNSTTGSCELADFASYDREGNNTGDVTGIDLCWATNVLKLNAQTPSVLSDVLMSQHQLNITPDSHTGRVDFSFEHSMVSENGVTVSGLPVLGFAVQRYTNANAAPGLMAQYGGLFQLSQSKLTSSD